MRRNAPVSRSALTQRHWFYEDYLRPLNPLLPQLSQRSFTHLIIASSPLYSDLSAEDYDAVWEEYCRYKRMVPCCGGILINSEGDKVGDRIAMCSPRVDADNRSSWSVDGNPALGGASHVAKSTLKNQKLRARFARSVQVAIAPCLLC